MEFAVLTDHSVKLKETEKNDKYLDLARELKKKLWNMKATILSIVIGVLCTVTKGLIQGLEDLEITGRVENIQTTALLRSAREEFWSLIGTCCHSKSSERLLPNADVKNSRSNYNTNTTNNNRAGKAIQWEMCKKFKFDHTNKWYMHNPAPVLENDTHKLLLDFDILTDHLVSARRPDLIIINKKKRELAK